MYNNINNNYIYYIDSYNNINCNNWFKNTKLLQFQTKYWPDILQTSIVCSSHNFCFFTILFLGNYPATVVPRLKCLFQTGNIANIINIDKEHNIILGIYTYKIDETRESEWNYTLIV